MARLAGLVRVPRRPLRRARPRRRHLRVLDPQGAAAGAVQGQPPRRGRPHPRADRADRAHAAALARGADRHRPERVARLAGRRSRTRSRRSSARAAGPRCASGSSSGRTSCSSSASSPTCRTRSTSTSRPRRSTSGSAARARAAGSSRSTSRSRTRARCASAPNTIADMTWKQMIDTMSCTECGRCQDVCPAYATGKELSPKLLIMGLRDQLFARARTCSPTRPASRRARSCRTPSATTSSGTASPAARASRSARSRSSTSTTSSTSAATSSWSRAASRPTARRCCATSSAPRTRGASRRRSGPTGREGLDVRVLQPGDDAARGSLLGRLRRLVRRARADDGRSRRRSCCRRPASTSRCSARASRAPATRPGGWATSTRSSRTPSRTSRR